MEKIWLNDYPAGVPAEIDPNRYSSLVDMFEQAVSRYADKPAFINMGQTMTFRELEQQSRNFAAWLQNSLDLKKGDRVALMIPNLLQYPVALFGILRAGMVAVNINPLYTPRELEHQLKDSGALVIIILSNCAHTLEKVIARTALRHVVLTQIGDQLSRIKGAVVNFVVNHVRRLVPAYHLPDAISFCSVLQKGAQLPFIKPDIANDDVAFFQYTGGTTGIAKGAMLTHCNMQANVAQAKAAYAAVLRDGRELVVTALPLYHIFALTVNCLFFLELGGTSLLITNPRDIPAMVKELSHYPFTVISGVNTLYNALLNNKNFIRLDFSALHFCIGGGMPVLKAVADRWEQVTGRHLLEGYGLTECSPLVTANPYNLKHYTGSIGLPVPSTDIRLINELGLDAAVSEKGELWVRGPQVMKGYWQQPEATKEVLRQGWLATGDIATMDDRGFLYLVDRKKDMILVSGFNVYPNEIEEVVAQHAKVLESAAVGVLSGSSGETVKLFVVKKEHSLTKNELLTHCHRYLTGYKVPRIIEFRDELPKSNIGKILRRELRDGPRNDGSRNDGPQTSTHSNAA